MITREQVADLREGDVVRVAEMGARTEDTVTIQGPIRRGRSGHLILGGYTIAEPDGTPTKWGHTLTVVSRAPRPLYVNHDRFCPAFGDVVRNASDAGDRRTWQYRDPADTKPWVGESESDVAPFRWWNRRDLPAHLRLLVDGETGQVVP